MSLLNECNCSYYNRNNNNKRDLMIQYIYQAIITQLEQYTNSINYIGIGSSGFKMDYLLFEQLYDDDDQFFATPGAKNDNVTVYLDELRLNDLPNNGFMPGYEKPI